MTPTPLPSGSTVDVNAAVLQHFLATYKPQPGDSPFLLQFAHALANHQPLTLLQKWFLFATLLPGPFSWKVALFTWLQGVTAQTFLPLWWWVGGILAAILLLLILRQLIRVWLSTRDKLVLLELAFPATANKSAHATEQFLTLLHGLARQRPFLQRLFGTSKRYALEIVASRDEGIRYVLGVPAIDLATVHRSLLSYLPGLKIREIPDYLPSNNPGSLSILELQQEGDFVLPLQTQKVLTEHDPIAYLTGTMTKLQPGEFMAFQVLATPVLPGSYRGVTKRINKLRQLLYRNQPLTEEVSTQGFGRVLMSIHNFTLFIMRACVFSIDFFFAVFVPGHNFEGLDGVKAPDQIHNPIEQELRESVQEKIGQPLYVTTLRLLVRANTNHERINGFLATFAPLASHRQGLMRKHGFAAFDPRPSWRRFCRREFSWFANPVLSPSELTDIYHFPYTDTTKTEDLVKVKSPALPAPLAFKQTGREFDNIFAVNHYGGSETPIGLTIEERRRHTYIIGATGSGKTTLLSTMIYQDIVNGKGLAVIDPHGQLIDRLLRVIPHERRKDVVWFAPDDDEYPVAINLLELPRSTGLSRSQLEKQKSLVASSLISVFQKFYDAKFFGPRMEYVLRNAILTALETPEPTLVTILDLLTQTPYRKHIVQTLQNKVLQNFWVHEFEKYGQLQKNAMISPITNKVGGLLSSPINYAILSQPTSTVDFGEIMNDGKILLCDLSKGKIGEDASSFFGSLILTKLQLAALSRARIPEADRRDFNLYVDEFQNFATPTFGELVSEARKYRVATILAHQSISQIDDRDLVKNILANVGTVICFRTANPEDERFILPTFQPEVNKHEIANLPLYTFYMKVSVGQAQDAFMAEVNNFTVERSDKTAEAVIAVSRAQYARQPEPSQPPTTSPDPSFPEATPALPKLTPVTEPVRVGKQRM